MDSNFQGDKANFDKLIEALSEIAKGLFEIARAIVFHAKHFGLNDSGLPSRAVKEVSQSISLSGNGDMNIAANEIAEALREIAIALQKPTEEGGKTL